MQNIRWPASLHQGFLLLLCCGTGWIGWAQSTSRQSTQEPAPVSAADNSTKTQAAPTTTAEQVEWIRKTVAAADENYRIGPGDLLDIRVFGHPEMSQERRVDNVGRLRMPFMDQEELPAACLTEAQLARLIQEKYRKYLRTPQVDVMVKDYRSQPAAIIGAVNRPGRIQLQRRVRLLDLLSEAGGPQTNAGTTVNLIRDREYNFCSSKLELVKSAAAELPYSTVALPQSPITVATTAITASTEVAREPSKKEDNKEISKDSSKEGSKEIAFEGELFTFHLRDVMLGVPEANIFIEPGDIVIVPEADQVYVVGGVMRSGAIPLRQTMHLTEAIGMAGGFFPDAAKNRVKVSRQVPGKTVREELTFDVLAIEKKKAEDPILFPNDIVDIPNSTGKSIGRSLLGIVAPTAAQLPMRVIRPY